MNADTGWACGKFGDKFFTVTAVRAQQKNADIAGPALNFSKAAMAVVPSSRVIELSKRPTSSQSNCIKRNCIKCNCIKCSAVLA